MTEKIANLNISFMFLIFIVLFVSIGLLLISLGVATKPPQQEQETQIRRTLLATVTVFPAGAFECLSISQRLPYSFILYDLKANTCGLVRVDDSQKLIDEILERDEKGQIVWLLGGTLTKSSETRNSFVTLLNDKKVGNK